MTEQYQFKWRHFEAEIILLCVRWYLRYALSFRDLEEMAYRCISDQTIRRSSCTRSGSGSHLMVIKLSTVLKGRERKSDVSPLRFSLGSCICKKWLEKHEK